MEFAPGRPSALDVRCFQHVNRPAGVRRELETPIRERADRELVTWAGKRRRQAASAGFDRASASRN